MVLKNQVLHLPLNFVVAGGILATQLIELLHVRVWILMVMVVL
jgi:hypothetical protein